MRKRNRALALLLALGLALGLLPMTAKAADIQVYTDHCDPVVYSGGVYDISVQAVGGQGILLYNWQLCLHQKYKKDKWYSIHEHPEWDYFFAPDDSDGSHLCMTTDWLEGEDKGTDWEEISFRCHVLDYNGNDGYSPEYNMHIFSTDALKRRIDQEHSFYFAEASPASTNLTVTAGTARDFTMHVNEFPGWMQESELTVRQYFEVRDKYSSGTVSGVHYSFLRHAPGVSTVIAHADLYCGDTKVSELSKTYTVTVQAKPETPKAPAAQAPAAPELSYAGGKFTVTNAKADQEYIVSDHSMTTVTLEDAWKSALSPAADGALTLTGAAKDKVNYVYTRVKETSSALAGTEVAWAYAYCGEADISMELNAFPYSMTINRDTGVYNAVQDDVIRLSVSSAKGDYSFKGVSGRDWRCVLPDGSSYGRFYADEACKTPVDADTQYKKVYIPLTNLANHIAFSASYGGSTAAALMNVGYADRGSFVVVLDDLSIPDVTVKQGTRTSHPAYPEPLEADTGPGKLTFACKSSGKAPVVQLSNGTLYVNAEGTAPGTYPLEAQYEGPDGSVKTMCAFTVTVTASETAGGPAVESIRLEPEAKGVRQGECFPLSATLLPLGAEGTITYQSSDTACAVVDEKGVVTIPDNAPLGLSCKITASCGEKSASCTVAVTAPKGFLVNFDPGGGTGSMAAVTVNPGEKLTLPPCAFTPPAGKVFDQWDLGPAGDAVIIPGDATVTALWRDPGAKPFPFTDVFPSDWYYSDVKTAYEMGLVNGRTETLFAPKGNMTYAEAIKLAACMHQLYTAGSVTLAPGSGKWYDPYVQYAKAQGILTGDRDWNAPATRAGYVEIFAAALPAEAFAVKNSVADGAIPDVPMSHPQAAAIYKLYRAGILVGNNSKGTFAPDNNISRAEVSAILTRMMVPDARKSVTLG